MFKVVALGIGILLFAAIGRAEPGGGTLKSKVFYEAVRYDRAYEKRQGNHVSIKISPPERLGADQFIYVEIYNYTPKPLGLVRFDLTLYNNNGYELTSNNIEGEDLGPGWSAVRKIAVPGKGEFPKVLNVRISRLEIFNDDAVSQVVNTYVQLVRIKGRDKAPPTPYRPDAAGKQPAAKAAAPKK